MDKSIYALSLHESSYNKTGTLEVVRVPGGRVYTQWFAEGGGDVLPRSSVFVPYNISAQEPPQICAPTGLMSSTFYNTIHLNGGDLTDATAAALTQDEKILAYMAAHPNDAFTRDELHELVLPNAQNTSVTRALNTLMNLQLVEKLAAFRKGRFGVRQHLWKFIDPSEPQRRLI